MTVATRLEASGQAGCVHVSHHTWQLLQQGGAAAAAPAAPAAALVHAGQAGAWEEGPGLQVGVLGFRCGGGCACKGPPSVERAGGRG